MKKTAVLAMMVVLSIASIVASESYRIIQREGRTMIVSTGENPVVLGIFDDAISPLDIPSEVYSFIDTYVGVDPENGDAFVSFSDAAIGDSIGPILGAIEYDQGTPYNDQCPVLNGARAVTGCVATAMAEVMRYWKYPAVGTGSSTYSSSLGATTYNFEEHPFDWDNMLETYTHSMLGVAKYNDTQAKAVSTLMLACGASVNMNYDYAGSGSYISFAYTALRDYFKYSSDIQYYESDSPNWEDWEETLQDQFDRSLPVIYGGTATSGGHAFVLDGYKIEELSSGGTRTRFHVNWGWNGTSNGWFLLRKLDPTGSDNYSNTNQRIVINIYPAGSQGIEDVASNEDTKAQKVLQDGQILVKRNGKTYSLQGQEVK